MDFYGLFSKCDEVVTNWCVRHGLIAGSMPCGRPGCDGQMKLCKRAGRPLGCSLRCNRSRDHEVSVLKNSFFERSKLDVRDILHFTRTYLEGHALSTIARSTGISYGGSAVDWGTFIRELFKEHFYLTTRFRKLSGVIELDESLFGRRVKYHRGDPTRGLKVWVFGMVERSSNTLILYPVADHSAKTLLPLIQRHVEIGSTIYSDGFSSYFNLNELGYRHFTVLHKYSFKKTYKNVETGVLEVVHTNRIEGAWKHAKDYFRKMSGTKADHWEGHMAEIMWRSEFKANVYEPFFQLLRSVYTLNEPPNFTYPTPLFQSWDGFGTCSNDDMLHPALSTEESTDSEVIELQAADAALEVADENVDAAAAPNVSAIVTEKSHRNGTGHPCRRLHLSKLNVMSELLQSSSDDADTTLHPATSTPKVSNQPTKGSDHVCCPAGFKATKKEGKLKKKAQTVRNPYSNSNFFWGDNMSSDDDFQPPKSKDRPRRKAKPKK